MRPEEQDAALLWDMQEAARSAARLLENLDLEKFLAPENETIRAAVERKLEILGEAARRISSELQKAHSEIPWKDIIGLRNIIIHQYEKVDYELIFRIVKDRIPGLLFQLSTLVQMPPETEA